MMHTNPQQLRASRSFRAHEARHTRFFTTMALYLLVQVGGGRRGA